MCTLTGAQGISTGRYHAAHLTNSEVKFYLQKYYLTVLTKLLFTLKYFALIFLVSYTLCLIFFFVYFSMFLRSGKEEHLLLAVSLVI